MRCDISALIDLFELENLVVVCVHPAELIVYHLHLTQPARMTSSPLEKRTSMISTGSLPSRRLLELSSSRPFVHQAWVITPFCLLTIHLRVC